MRILKRPSIQTQLGIFTWHGYDARTLNTIDIYHRLCQITNDGFGIEMAFGKQAIQATTQKNTHVYLLKQHDDIIGFAFLKVSPYAKGEIVYLSKVCIAKEAQGMRLTTALIEAIIDDFNVVILSAKSQHEAIMKLVRRVDGLCFPFDQSYSSQEGKSIIELFKNASILSDEEVKNLDLESGVLAARYGMRLGDYKVSSEEEYSRNLNRDIGDAFLITNIIK